MRSFAKIKSRKMVSHGHLLMKVNHDIVANFYFANMSFNAVRKNKILTKISKFTVISRQSRLLPSAPHVCLCSYIDYIANNRDPDQTATKGEVLSEFISFASMIKSNLKCR